MHQSCVLLKIPNLYHMFVDFYETFFYKIYSMYAFDTPIISIITQIHQHIFKNKFVLIWCKSTIFCVLLQL